MFEQFIIFIISLVANIFSAFSGGGAGLIQLPALIFLGLPFAIALATHKIASVALGLGATIRHLNENKFQKTYILLMLSGLPGVYLGANLILHVPDLIATTLLGIMTIGLGLYSVFNPKLGQQPKIRQITRQRIIIGSIGLFLIGILNGSLTSGTGLFVTLWLISFFGLDYKLAVAYTLVFVGLLWNGTGAITLSLLGEIHWPWLPALVLHQHRFDEYRVAQSIQDKAWVAGNGYSLVKTHNAVLDALVCSLRASHEAVIHVVAAFGKGTTIPCKPRLVANRFMTRCTHQTYVDGVLILGSLLGGYTGAHLSIVAGNRWIKRGYEVITLLVGLKLIWH